MPIAAQDGATNGNSSTPKGGRRRGATGSRRWTVDGKRSAAGSTTGSRAETWAAGARYRTRRRSGRPGSTSGRCVNHDGVPLGRCPTHARARGQRRRAALGGRPARSPARTFVRRSSAETSKAGSLADAGRPRGVAGRRPPRARGRGTQDVTVVTRPPIRSRGRRVPQSTPTTERTQEENTWPARSAGGRPRASTAEQHEDETLATRPGRLRVEERAEAPMFRSLAELYADRGFFENRRRRGQAGTSSGRSPGAPAPS